MGDLALQQQDVQRAVCAYQQALGATDVVTKALAYYKRARAFLSLNLDETLLHYEQQTGCSQRQAVRDLNDLCEQDILRREGQGRGVRYVAGH